MANLIRQRDEHERVPRPDVQVVRVQQERRRAVDAVAGRHLQLYVLVRDVCLLIIHPATGVSAEENAAARAARAEGNSPHDAHKLAADDRVAAIRADAEVERNVGVAPAVEVPNAHRVGIKVNRLDFASEQDAHARRRHACLQQRLVEERAVNRVNTLGDESAVRKSREAGGQTGFGR